MIKELWDVQEKLRTLRMNINSMPEEERLKLRKDITEWVKKLDKA